MSIEEANQPGYRIIDDATAGRLLETGFAKNEIGERLINIAKATSLLYSFEHTQTYPRPNHPSEEKRLHEVFTFVAIIISLRCTLETEKKVVENIVEVTHGDIEELAVLEEQELESIIRPAGLSNQKSKWIKEGVNRLLSDELLNSDILRNIPVLEARNRLLDLRGMGEKAVDCYLLLGLDVVSFPIDVNVFKLMAREFPRDIYGENEKPNFSSKKQVNRAKILIESSVEQRTDIYQVLHTYLLLAQKYKIDA